MVSFSAWAKVVARVVKDAINAIRIQREDNRVYIPFC
jgi:hypothetical protein